MDRTTILNKYNTEEDKLFASKILDKIRISKTRNQIVNTDFLDMYKRKICKDILDFSKERNYKFYLPNEDLEKSILIIYPEKFNTIFLENKYDYSSLVKLIRIILPNELKGKYSHRDYLSGIMKLGIRREKMGDIIVFENGADIVVSNEVYEYILNNLSQLTRFSKAKIEGMEIQNLRKPIVKKEEKRITVSSLRIDNIVCELAGCSRSGADELIKNQRVFINYENETRNSKMVKEDDVIIIRGKGKFKILKINGETKKGKISLFVEHNI